MAERKVITEGDSPVLGGALVEPLIAPIALTTTSKVPGSNVPRMVRVIVPKTGTLKDVAYYIGVSSGNRILSVYDCGAADGTAYTKLWDSGSVAMPASGWDSSDPALAVKKGQHLMLGLMFSSATAGYAAASVNLLANATPLLPVNFLPDGEGNFRRLAFTVAALGSFAMPATFTNASLAGYQNPPVIIARIA